MWASVRSGSQPLKQRDIVIACSLGGLDVSGGRGDAQSGEFAFRPFWQRQYLIRLELF